MKKILLMGFPSTYNYGSGMMGIAMIHWLSEKLHETPEFRVSFTDESDYYRIQEEVGEVRIIKQMSVPSTNRKNRNSLAGVINAIRTYSNEIKRLTTDVDCVIYLGGDTLYEGYSKKSLYITLYRLWMVRKRVPLFLIGQTIQGFSSFRKILARIALRNVIVTTRDRASRDYLASIGLRSVKLAADLAFLDLVKQNGEEYLKKLNEEDLIENNYVTLVVSGMSDQYVSDRKAYIESWKDIVLQIQKREGVRDKKIVLLSHVLRPSQPDDDRDAISELVNSLPKESLKRIVLKTNTMLPSEARTILGRGLFTITGRMHAAISTFQMGKPAISLSYSLKYRGVIGDGLGMNELVIEAKNDGVWKSGKIVDQVMDKVDYVLANYDSLVSRIGPAVEENKKLAMGQIEDIVARIKEKVV